LIANNPDPAPAETNGPDPPSGPANRLSAALPGAPRRGAPHGSRLGGRALCPSAAPCGPARLPAWRAWLDGVPGPDLRALIAHGCLLFTRRRIPLPIRSPKAAAIP